MGTETDINGQIKGPRQAEEKTGTDRGTETREDTDRERETEEKTELNRDRLRDGDRAGRLVCSPPSLTVNPC